MGIIKLQEAGESLTAVIKSAERVKGQYGEQVKFATQDGDLYVPLDSALRQLERIPMGVEDCAGETLTFSRDPNNSRPGAKPYWGIRLAGMGDNAPKPTGKRLPPPDAPPSRGKLPFDEESFPSEEYGQSVHSPEPDAYADPRPLPAFHRPVQTPSVPPVAPVATEKMTRARAYLDLFAWVQAEAKVAPEVAQPIAATIWIDWKQAGLVK